MKLWTLKALLAAALLSCGGMAWSSDKHSAEDTKKDITRHRAMATAHEAAAKCLESGKKEDVCMKELLTACKGLGIGKYCGMKHEH
jgi:hypothetical protein